MEGFRVHLITLILASVVDQVFRRPSPPHRLEWYMSTLVEFATSFRDQVARVDVVEHCKYKVYTHLRDTATALKVQVHETTNVFNIILPSFYFPSLFSLIIPQNSSLLLKNLHTLYTS